MRVVVFSFPVISLTSGNLEAVELLLEILGGAFSGNGQIALGFQFPVHFPEKMLTFAECLFYSSEVFYTS